MLGEKLETVGVGSEAGKLIMRAKQRNVNEFDIQNSTVWLLLHC